MHRSLVLAVAVALIATLASCSPQQTDVAPSGGNCSLSVNDVNAINFALALHRLNTDFYTSGIALFGFGSNETAAAPGSETGVNATAAAPANATAVERLNQTSTALVQTISQQEQMQLNALMEALTSRGCQALQEGQCTFNVSTRLHSREEFLAGARDLENNTVGALNGLADRISSPQLRLLVASINTVHARHSAVVNELSGASPFPQPFDSPVSPEEVLSTMSPFIVACTIMAPSVVECGTAGNRTIMNANAGVMPAANDHNTFTNTNGASRQGSALVTMAASASLLVAALKLF